MPLVNSYEIVRIRYPIFSRYDPILHNIRIDLLKTGAREAFKSRKPPWKLQRPSQNTWN